ncbi:hypothetical protein ABZ547_26745 [Streptomyces sparsogenes]|uniref:hypothetical protein n=1 Tax=Streptomyces sparsogenes TaxID=67365 RepID=UPI0033C71204
MLPQFLRVTAHNNTVLQQWPAIAPELAVHVSAVAFDTPSGRLDLCPDSSA